ncbi:hypothetical protein [Sphaerisporangium rufum]|nr:hypothetical protein [Sphaerisporangium rufum]
MVNRLALLALMAAGAAGAVGAAPSAHLSHSAGLRGDGTGPRDRVTVTVSGVECPAGRAEVVMTAPRGRGTTGYSVYRGDTLVREGVLWPGVQRSVPVHVAPRTTERIAVTVDGQGTTRHQVWSRCDSAEDRAYEYGEYRYAEGGSSGGSGSSWRAHRYNPLLHRHPHYLPRVRHLPYTGPPADLYGRAATAAGLVVFGAMLWWLAAIWPGRAPACALARRPAPRPLPGAGGGTGGLTAR